MARRTASRGPCECCGGSIPCSPCAPNEYPATLYATPIGGDCECFAGSEALAATGPDNWQLDRACAGYGTSHPDFGAFDASGAPPFRLAFGCTGGGFGVTLAWRVWKAGVGFQTYGASVGAGVGGGNTCVPLDVTFGGPWSFFPFDWRTDPDAPCSTLPTSVRVTE